MHYTDEDVVEVPKHFALYGDMESIKSFGNGHINSTYLSVWNQGGARLRYVHQRINRHVFAKPEEVIENICGVTAHIAAKFAAAGGSRLAAYTPHAASPVGSRELSDSQACTHAPAASLAGAYCAVDTQPYFFTPSRRTLTLIPTKEGSCFYTDKNGEYWRTYLFIEGSSAFDTMENPQRAFKAGAAVGIFHYVLSDYSGVLHETIPDFHNMSYRYAQLDEAIRCDSVGRVDRVRKELRFLEENRVRGMLISDGLISGQVRRCVTHNDTKLNNMLFDNETGEVLCLIDLDTVMPGSVLFDLGDLIRTGTNTACEDEQDLSKVHCDAQLFHAITTGYLSTAGSTLSSYEKSLIAESGRIITQIMAVRFLTDYLNGDRYYKTARPEHNLDRARTQIALMQSMDEQWDTLQRVSYCE